MNNKVILLLVLALIASGCTDTEGSNQKSGSGLVVEDFSIADNTLRPNQESMVEATITNYNEAPTDLEAENVTLYSLGSLEKSSKSCNPETIGSAREDLSPSMRCTWNIEAPGEEYIQGFESKPISFKLGVRYNTTLENSDPIKIMFDEVSEIEESGEFSQSFGNNDISASIEGDKPVAVDTQRNMDLEIQNTGPGEVIGNLSLDCRSASSLEFTNCPTEEELIRGEAGTSIGLEANTVGTRNIYISTSYKYRKSPNLDIEVVNN